MMHGRKNIKLYLIVLVSAIPSNSMTPSLHLYSVPSTYSAEMV